MSGVAKQGKVTRQGHLVTEAIGSTCNIRKITGKGQVKGKHRSETYRHQKLSWKGNKGRGDEYTCTGLGLVCPEVLKSIVKVLESSVSLRKHQGTSGKG